MSAVRSIADHLFAPLRVQSTDIADLFGVWNHSSQLRRQRRVVLKSRTRLMAALFALLVPLWILPDLLLLDTDHWLPLAGLRVASALAFTGLAWSRDPGCGRLEALLRVGLLLAVPTVFHLLAAPLLAGLDPGGPRGVLLQVYELLPFVVVAGLAVFPLTVLETLLYALPIFLAYLYGVHVNGDFRFAENVGTLWLLLLVTGAAMVSSLSQLQYMIALVRRASADTLTGALNRAAGEETLELLFGMAVARGEPLALMFIDLDRFKGINDGWGHEAGDTVLRAMAAQVRTALRRGDVLVRWGGEEFLVLLANSDVQGARLVVERLRAAGFGERPDGTPLTASIGLAERLIDRASDWPELIEVADQRMYAAKLGGRDRAILPGEAIVR